MQVHLKSLENYATSDMKALLDHAVRLEVAGVNSFRRKLTEETNTVRESSGNQAPGESSSNQFAARLDGLEDAISNLTFGKQTFRNQRYRSTARGRSQKKTVGSCYYCGDKSHFVRQCPKRYCQSCGGAGHDAWSKRARKPVDYPLAMPKMTYRQMC